VRPNGPFLKLVSFWNGTLTSDATGFCRQHRSLVDASAD
jgi:hypothetical protein